MKNDPAIGQVLGCVAYSPCSLDSHHPDLFWYGIHGVEELFTIMGPGCISVSRVHTEDTDVVTGIWRDGRVGTFRGSARRQGGLRCDCVRHQGNRPQRLLRRLRADAARDRQVLPDGQAPGRGCRDAGDSGLHGSGRREQAAERRASSHRKAQWIRPRLRMRLGGRQSLLQLVGCIAVARLFDIIRQLVAAERYVVGLHASERLDERGIMESQVVVGLEDGKLLAERLDSEPNPTIEVREQLPDGTSFVAVWAYLSVSDVAKLVTVFFDRI